MADNNQSSLDVEKIQKPQISEDEARYLTREWLEINVLKKKDTYRIGKAVLVYYPFWRYIREDGNETKIICKPAFGTLFADIQTLSPKTVPIDRTDEDIVPATIEAKHYYPELYGLARGEMLVGIPFWLVSYKYKNSVYMLKIDAEIGTVIPEWHPFKDPINWRKIALITFIPIFIITVLAILLHPIFFVFDALYLIALLWHSKMMAILNTKREEGLNGS